MVISSTPKLHPPRLLLRQYRRAHRESSRIDNSMTPTFCNSFCQSFPYYGVKAGNQCYYSHTVRDGCPKVEDRDCGAVCSGSKDCTPKCGGTWRLDLYSSAGRTGPPAVNYTAQGCFIDQEVHELANGTYNDDSMTPQLCAGLRKGYRYVGVENGSQCFCGNVWPSTNSEVEGRGCNDTCPGDPALTCGVAWRMGLYAIG